MSYTPWQPSTPPPHAPDRKRPFIALAILLVAIAGLALLGLNYLNTANTNRANPLPVVALPSPTGAVAVIVPTAGRPGGLNGPDQGTDTPTPQPAPTTLAQATSYAQPTPALSPAESALQALNADNVPARDLYSIAARLKFKTSAPISHTTGLPAGNYAGGAH